MRRVLNTHFLLERAKDFHLCLARFTCDAGTLLYIVLHHTLLTALWQDADWLGLTPYHTHTIFPQGKPAIIVLPTFKVTRSNQLNHFCIFLLFHSNLPLHLPKKCTWYSVCKQEENHVFQRVIRPLTPYSLVSNDSGAATNPPGQGIPPPTRATQLCFFFWSCGLVHINLFVFPLRQFVV